MSPARARGLGRGRRDVLSALSAPIYVKSLVDAALRRKSRFVVTPKGATSSPDRLSTFRIHLLWGGLFGTSLTASFFLGAYPRGDADVGRPRARAVPGAGGHLVRRDGAGPAPPGGGAGRTDRACGQPGPVRPGEGPGRGVRPVTPGAL